MKHGILIGLLLCLSCSVDMRNSADSKQLVGIWQETPEVASGWADTYQFFDNGDFTFHYNQMICDKRTLDYSGSWEFVSAAELKLIIKTKTVLEGGRLVPSLGSCGSDYEIVEGELKKIKLEDTEVQKIQVSAITTDKNNRDLPTRKFASRSFWKFGDDPTKYN